MSTIIPATSRVLTGENPWMEGTINVGVRNSDTIEYSAGITTKFIFTDDCTEEVSNIIAVYEFYEACAIKATEKEFENIDGVFDPDEDSIASQVAYPAIELKTVKYFGSDRVRNVLDKHGNEFPKEIYNALSSIARMKIKECRDDKGVSFMNSTADSSNPFPSIKPIN